jgi:hypothetical protein
VPVVPPNQLASQLCQEHRPASVTATCCELFVCKCVLRCVELVVCVRARTLGADLVGALEHAVVPVRSSQGGTTLRG